MTSNFLVPSPVSDSGVSSATQTFPVSFPSTPPPIFSKAARDLILDTTSATVPNKTSHLQINLHLHRSKFVAGQDLSGKLSVICSSGSKVKLGDITLGVIGFEQTHGGPNQPKAFRRIFVSSGLVLQNRDVVSEAVGASTDGDGYRLAKKGTTAFDFRIQLPSTCNMLEESAGNSVPCPSSFWNNKYGGIRYILVA